MRMCKCVCETDQGQERGTISGPNTRGAAIPQRTAPQRVQVHAEASRRDPPQAGRGPRASGQVARAEPQRALPATPFAAGHRPLTGR